MPVVDIIQVDDGGDPQYSWQQVTLAVEFLNAAGGIIGSSPWVCRTAAESRFLTYPDGTYSIRIACPATINVGGTILQYNYADNNGAYDLPKPTMDNPFTFGEVPATGGFTIWIYYSVVEDVDLTLELTA